jgi:hypothetical protein
VPRGLQIRAFADDAPGIRIAPAGMPRRERPTFAIIFGFGYGRKLIRRLPRQEGLCPVPPNDDNTRCHSAAAPRSDFVTDCFAQLCHPGVFAAASIIIV